MDGARDHAILEGVKRHSASGIMKARWDDVDLFEMGEKPLAFGDHAPVRIGLT